MPKFDYDAVKDILRCPNSLSPLMQEGDSLVCVDPECRLQYAILDGIPNMLIDDASQLPVDSWRDMMSRNSLAPSSDNSGNHLADN